MKKVFCDLCKKEITVDKNYIKVEMRATSPLVDGINLTQEQFEDTILASGEITATTNANNDLCPECVSKIIEFMKGVENDNNGSTEKSSEELPKQAEGER